MKALGYYLFGVISTLTVLVMFFNHYVDEFLDEYWLCLLYKEYTQEWFWSNIVITSICTMAILIWVFNLGKGIKDDEKEPLFKQPKEEID